MRPNPVDTTNALMVQLIKVIANGPDAVDISSLSSLTPYPSSTVWIQTLSYASLAFSVLAAFGAVMGKQWINSYKAARGRGTLEDRGLQRQRKLDGLEYWQLQTVLGALLVLLQISLLLFGLSLSANMYGQEITISSIIIGTTAFGMIFYLATILVAVLSPDSPFQSPGSAILNFFFKRFLPDKRLPGNDTSGISRAVCWILETSTNPEYVAAAAAMVPLIQWSPNVDVSAICGRLCDTFKACRDKLECVKGVAHFLIQPNHGNDEKYIHMDISDARNSLIRDAFTTGRQAWDQAAMTKEDETKERQRHKADVRAALRVMVVYGRSWCLSHPDDEDLTWDGDLQWYQPDGHPPSYEEFDWLIDYLGNRADNEDVATEVDALLALSGMRGLGKPDKRGTYVRLLIRCMGPKRDHRVRHAALRVIAEAREELASITSNAMPQDIDAGVLNDLSSAILTVIHTAPFHEERDLHYCRLVFALARNEEWCQRMTSHGHVKRCISLVDSMLQNWVPVLLIYLAGILLRIDPSGTVLPLNPREPKWRTLIETAWRGLRYIEGQEIHGCIDVLPTFVEATRQFLRGSEPRDVQRLAGYVHRVLVHFRATVCRADESPVNAVLPAVQGLYDELVVGANRKW